jgi:hypothetical protein
MSFLPGFGSVGWPIADRSPSATLGLTFYVIHIFRMTAFFMIAGYFAHLLYRRRGARAFITNRALRIVVPLVVGWIVVFPMIAAVFAWAVSQSGTTPRAAPSPIEVPRLAFPLTHLWFLYVLVWFYAGTLIVRSVVARWVDPQGHLRAAVDRIVGALVRSYAAPIALAIPVFVALISARLWVPWFGITTPDQSLLPNVPASAAFITAFGFGWIAERQRDLLQVWQRQWAVNLGAAIALTIACISIAGITPQFTPAALGDTTRTYAALYGIGSWAWTFAILGVALRFFSDDSPRRRYVSDASYWIYIMHLPLVFVLQAAVMTLAWHWTVKFAIVVGGALVVLFGAYHLFVRRTFIGEVLNGTRHGATGHRPSTATEPQPPAELIDARRTMERCGRSTA